MSDALDRLLKAARAAGEHARDMPYGFDTRVVALARAEKPNGATLARLLRQITVTAILVFTTATAAAYWQFENNRELVDSAATAYVIADSAIDSATSQ